MKVYFLNDNSCGDGELGKEILEHLLLESIALAKSGDVFIFTNEACNLVCRTEYIDIIKALNTAVEKGVTVSVCERSLTHLGLLESLHVGKKASFKEMAELLTKGEVVSL